MACGFAGTANQLPQHRQQFGLAGHPQRDVFCHPRSWRCDVVLRDIVHEQRLLQRLRLQRRGLTGGHHRRLGRRSPSRHHRPGHGWLLHFHIVFQRGQRRQDLPVAQHHPDHQPQQHAPVHSCRPLHLQHRCDPNRLEPQHCLPFQCAQRTRDQHRQATRLPKVGTGGGFGRSVVRPFNADREHVGRQIEPGHSRHGCRHQGRANRSRCSKFRHPDPRIVLHHLHDANGQP